jgi:uncharacterized membrane protein YfcA
MLPHFTPAQWLLAVLAAFCIGFSKSGFAGSGLITIVIMAQLFGPLESTGILLPMLLCGDVLSVFVFHQHARWKHISQMFLPTAIGIVIAFLVMWRLMKVLPANATRSFGAVIGWIVLAMVALQAFRKWRPALFEKVPHARWFAHSMGVWSGITTMLANAAGPVMSLYFLAIALPKYELVGTSAWFFLIVNSFKVPFSVLLGLIHGSSLLLNALLVPAIALGIFSGQRLIRRIPQQLFETLLLLFAALASLRLIGVF